MILKINPTRIELIQLKNKLKIVEQGHNLLKKKRDGLMKEFLKVIKELRELRENLDKEIVLSFRHFIFARAFMRNKEIEQIFSIPSKKIRLEVEKKNIMGTEVPIFNLKEEGDFLNYSLISSKVNLDLGLLGINGLLKDLIKLAEFQKTALFLSYEIEKTRRRVNALEYIHLPNLNATIKYISTKLEERERFENIILMKTKELIA